MVSVVSVFVVVMLVGSTRTTIPRGEDVSAAVGVHTTVDVTRPVKVRLASLLMALTRGSGSPDGSSRRFEVVRGPRGLGLVSVEVLLELTINAIGWTVGAFAFVLETFISASVASVVAVAAVEETSFLLVPSCVVQADAVRSGLSRDSSGTGNCWILVSGTAT